MNKMIRIYRDHSVAAHTITEVSYGQDWETLEYECTVSISNRKDPYTILCLSKEEAKREYDRIISEINGRKGL